MHLAPRTFGLDPPAPLADPRCATVRDLTGHPVRWYSVLPTFHALQWLDHEAARAGLVWTAHPGPFAFAALRFDPGLVRRFAITPPDLAAAALERLGLIQTRELPRPFRRNLRVRPIPADRVVRP
ncbi:hypothetical protein [Paracoccus sp. PAR01]|uniref:hypothetical protein n=1 Tax=Paracoccus sp. PAR01 TaxID=2769282 RepID=UPI00177D9308|nr:hypothetical protein [Paracoccus sp. PAR01]MBD9526211.1 hypothetical protein [Paracoccus sp. PAR01]